MKATGAGRGPDGRVPFVRSILSVWSVSASPCRQARRTCGHSPAAENRVTSQRVSIEHVRITSTRTFAEVKAALEAKLRRYDDRIAALIRSGDIERARAELEKLAAPTGLTILQSLNPGVALSLRGGRAMRCSTGSETS